MLLGLIFVVCSNPLYRTSVGPVPEDPHPVPDHPHASPVVMPESMTTKTQ